MCIWTYLYFQIIHPYAHTHVCIDIHVYGSIHIQYLYLHLDQVFAEISFPCASWSQVVFLGFRRLEEKLGSPIWSSPAWGPVVTLSHCGWFIGSFGSGLWSSPTWNPPRNGGFTEVKTGMKWASRLVSEGNSGWSWQNSRGELSNRYHPDPLVHQVAGMQTAGPKLGARKRLFRAKLGMGYKVGPLAVISRVSSPL